MSDRQDANAPTPTPEQRSIIGRLLRLALTNKLLVAIVVILLVVLGMIVSPFGWNLGPIPRERVPVDAIPDLGENQQIVFTEWPGHSPQDVDDQVTLPLTTAMMGLKDVETIRSSSKYGFSSVYVIFNEDADFYESRTRLLEKLSSLPAQSLPQGVAPRLGPEATALGQVFWYTLEGHDPNGDPVGGWDLAELRTIQDYTVRYALSAVEGVAEVASVGGFVREYHVELDPQAMDTYDVSLQDVTRAIQGANLDVSARTMEINRVEYFVRGIGFVRSLDQLEEAVITTRQGAPILLKQVAAVTLGPARRRGALDKDGVEAVGGVVVARFGANPMETIQAVQDEVRALQDSLPRKVLIDQAAVATETVRQYAARHGFEAYDDAVLNDSAWVEHLTRTPREDWPTWATVSSVRVVPFYDRSKLIGETLGTLEAALTQQLLITLLVVVLMVANLRTSVLIGSMLPLAVLLCFLAMKLFGVDANIVALSGIAIAIGTIVDMGIVLSDNMLRHLDQAAPDEPKLEVIHRAASEVGPAVLTAVATTVISFLPVFTMVGQEGKLFRPLAFTKTFVLIGSILVALLVLPPLAMLVLGRGRRRPGRASIVVRWTINIILVLAVFVLLTGLWEPLGPSPSGRTMTWLTNLLFVGGIIAVLIGAFRLFQWGYPAILGWCLNHKVLFLMLPAGLTVFGLMVWLGFTFVMSPVTATADAVGLGQRWRRTNLYVHGSASLPGLSREFMPDLDEGSFLWMPTISVHGSISEALDVLSHQDRAIRAVPEVDEVVGKIGRVDSALDPAPISMVETVIHYKSEYRTDPNGRRVRQWRDHIRSPEDIWREIAEAGEFPGSTSAPRLQPIETRLVMLQTGMTARMGIKLFGEDLDELEKATTMVEQQLRRVPAIEPATVNASRVIGKPYLVVDAQDEQARRRMRLHNLRVADVLSAMQAAVGGEIVTHTIEGRKRLGVRVQYQRELRDDIEAIGRVQVPTPDGAQIPLEEIVDVEYVAGPQMIRSEDTFKVAYITFGPSGSQPDLEVVREAEEHLRRQLASGELVLPEGIRWEFAGAYEAEIRASRTLSLILPLAGLLIFLLLYMQFRSALGTAIVFMGIFVAFAGGFLLIWLYGRPWFLDFQIFGQSMREVFQVHPVNLSVAVWVGFLALFGIATDDGVVMGTYLQQTFRRRKTRDVADIRSAVVAAGTRRVRACLMTTATTILALLPVLTSAGRGSDIMIPMAIPSFGGMAIEVLTMLVVPVLYCAIQEQRLRATSQEDLAPLGGVPVSSDPEHASG